MRDKQPKIILNTLHNTYGTIIYFFCQWVTTVVVVRLAGYGDAGVYALAISFSNIFGFISRYGVRNYQISDTSCAHTDATYLAVRGITSGAALLTFLASFFLMGFSAVALWCSVVLFIFKLLESCADVIFGIFQRHGRYSAIAISFTMKGILPLFVFVTALWLGSGIVAACVAMAAGYLFTVVFYDLPVMLHVQNFARGVSASGIKIVLVACTPLMVVSLANPYMTFITRYVVEQMYTEELLGYYSSFSMVVVVMSTLAGSIFAVAAPEASTRYRAGKYSAVKRMTMCIVMGIAVLAAVLVLAAWWLGEWALGLVFGPSILPYSYLLLPMIGVSVLLTLVVFFSTLLTAFQKGIPVLYANLVGAVVCTALAWPLAQALGMLGACLCLAVGMLTQVICLIVLCVRALTRPDQ